MGKRLQLKLESALILDHGATIRGGLRRYEYVVRLPERCLLPTPWHHAKVNRGLYQTSIKDVTKDDIMNRSRLYHGAIKKFRLMRDKYR